MTRAVTDVLKLPPRAGTPDYRILRYLSARRYPLPQAVAYAVETEPGIQALVYRLYQESWFSRPPRTGTRAILYVAHLSSDAELREEPLIREVMQAEPDSPVFTCDVRGIGESRPETCGVNTFHSRYGSDFFYAIHSLMLDRPYLGQKTHDVLCVLDWLASLGHTDVHLVAKGWGALAGTFAAVLHQSAKQVTLKNALDLVSRRGRVRGVRLAAVGLAAQRPGPLRPARLLPCAAGQRPADHRTVERDGDGVTPDDSRSRKRDWQSRLSFRDRQTAKPKSVTRPLHSIRLSAAAAATRPRSRPL